MREINFVAINCGVELTIDSKKNFYIVRMLNNKSIEYLHQCMLVKELPKSTLPKQLLEKFYKIRNMLEKFIDARTNLNKETTNQIYWDIREELRNEDI